MIEESWSSTGQPEAAALPDALRLITMDEEPGAAVDVVGESSATNHASRDALFLAIFLPMICLLMIII